MRVLITSKPILDHILILYNISQSLAKQGVEVFVLSVPGFKEIPIKEQWNFIDSELKEMSFDDHNIFQSLAQEINYEFHQEEQHLIETLRVIEQHNIDLVILDSSLAGASYACEIKQIPWFSVEPATFSLAAKEENDRDDNETIVRFMQRYLNQLRRKYELEPLPLGFRSEISYVGLSPALHMIPSNNMNQIESPNHFHFIGPQLYRSSEEYFKKTAFQHHVLIDTLTYDNPQFLTQTIHFIEACIDALHGKENLIIRCTSTMIEKFNLNQKNVMFVDNSKHQVVHFTNCKLVINQGSYYSFYNSIENQVPQLSITQGWDSRYFTNFVKGCGLGEVMDPSECSQTSIFKQYSEIMSNVSTYQEKIKQFNKQCNQINPTFKITKIADYLLRKTE